MDYQWAMMGYSIHNQYWKNGYGAEKKSCVTVIFNSLHFHRIELHIRVDNEPSVRLAERAGFSFDKREAFSLENGKWMDFLIYFKIRR